MDFACKRLRPRLGYLPKVASTLFCSQAVVLHSFSPPTFVSWKSERLHKLCSVRVLNEDLH